MTPGRSPFTGVAPGRSLRGAAVALLAFVGGCAAGPAAPDPDGASAAAPDPAVGCSVDLRVRYSPRVAAPASQALAASLLPGTGYALRYVRTLGTAQLLRLRGPDGSCEAGIVALRGDDRILSVEVDESQFRQLVRDRAGAP